jgi:hypothetical protein
MRLTRSRWLESGRSEASSCRPPVCRPSPYEGHREWVAGQPETCWDEELLGLELLDLKGMGIDMDLTGFDMPEIDDILSRIDIQGRADRC